jgi:hypothetical protein
MKKPKPYLKEKTKVPVRLAWRAALPTYPRRSRDLVTLPSSPFPAPYASIYTDDANPVLLTRNQTSP